MSGFLISVVNVTWMLQDGRSTAAETCRNCAEKSVLKGYEELHVNVL